MFDIQLYLGRNQRLINKFYKQHKQNVSCNAQDTIAFASFKNNDTDAGTPNIIAAGLIRVISQNDTHLYILRSVFVAPENRKQGIARSVCQTLLSHVNESIYCFCETSLEHFYEKLGMVKLSELPEFMQGSFLEKEYKKGLSLMLRPCKIANKASL